MDDFRLPIEVFETRLDAFVPFFPNGKVRDLITGATEEARQKLALTAEYVLRHVPALPPGVTELICHPGEGDPETRERYARWGYHWEQELKALTDPAVREALELCGVRVTTFGRVPGEAGCGKLGAARR